MVKKHHQNNHSYTDKKNHKKTKLNVDTDLELDDIRVVQHNQDDSEVEDITIHHEENKEGKETKEIRINISDLDRNKNVKSISNFPFSPKDVKWNVCCLSLDRECFVYFTQMLILATCIGVSLYKVSTTDNESNQIWISILSSCIGIIIPNPKLKANN